MDGKRDKDRQSLLSFFSEASIRSSNELRDFRDLFQSVDDPRLLSEFACSRRFLRAAADNEIQARIVGALSSGAGATEVRQLLERDRCRVLAETQLRPLHLLDQAVGRERVAACDAALESLAARMSQVTHASGA